MSFSKLDRNISRVSRMFPDKKDSFFRRFVRLLGRAYSEYEVLGHFSLLSEIDYTFLGTIDQTLYKVTVKYIHSGSTLDYFFKDYITAEEFFRDLVKKSFY